MEHETGLFQAVVEAAGEAILLADAAAGPAGPRIEYVNPAFCRLVGLPTAELVGCPLDMLLRQAEAGLRLALHATLAAGETFRGDAPGRRAGGEAYVAELAVSPVRDEAGTLRRWLVLARDVTEQRRAEEAMREETRTLELLNRTGAQLAAELDLQKLVQAVTDAATTLSGARFGAFFYADEEGERGQLNPYVLSGAAREVFTALPIPHSTAVFAPTLRGEAIIRSDDITRDPRYGRHAPHHGMPPGHMPVRSYLAAPVVSRSGTVLGTLFFGHPEPGVFTERAERIVTGIAGQAAVAIDNARLYTAVQADIAERKQAAARQELLLRELNHRVNNTLAIVQSLAVQSLRAEGPAEQRVAAFQRRLLALVRTHALLMRENWTGVPLRSLVEAELAPHGGPEGGRTWIEGEDLQLPPEIGVVMGMALHELATNAARHGALSGPRGEVRVQWRRESQASGRLCLCWEERGGMPLREPPAHQGFGTRLLQSGLARQVGGEVTLRFAPGGLRCRIALPKLGRA
ncbi:HWE histidine kinase domain-containing protein [Roseomonas sp. E05]|uniref:sensor histidine kinase n=1 Tax=Roseomonas sp. E05 TaxID=3046310 RepID=UPI0024BBD3CD|nr:HWE histidine kinase domain-containing protein [Roseomonas sp. E05]MDJ0388510.1 HWE histidine kinase domain-containing protein [Roseomonas sp. E05]